MKKFYKSLSPERFITFFGRKENWCKRSHGNIVFYTLQCYECTFGLAWLVPVLFQFASKDIMTMYRNNQVRVSANHRHVSRTR
jgi:hypothetical protein